MICDVLVLLEEKKKTSGLKLLTKHLTKGSCSVGFFWGNRCFFIFLQVLEKTFWWHHVLSKWRQRPKLNTLIRKQRCSNELHFLEYVFVKVVLLGEVLHHLTFYLRWLKIKSSTFTQVQETVFIYLVYFFNVFEIFNLCEYNNR